VLRFSSYSILSTPLPDGSYVLMNGLSGAVDLLPPWMGQLLERVLLNRELALEAELLASLEPETVESFEQRGHLTRLSPEEEKELLRLVAEASHSAAASKPAFLIVPNLDCNYRCTYCFERPLQNSLYQIHSPAHAQRPSTNIVMSRHQVDAAYRAIGEIQQQAGSQRGGQLILYGGEPLDRDNYPIVRYIVSRGLEEGFYFAAVTNGHDLDAYLGLLGPGLIEQLQITFDGPKAIHDRRRIHRGHESSFDKIVANIHRVLAETEAEVQLRVHVAPDTLSCFGELINFFNQQGWINNPRVVIYASTVYAKDENGRVRSTVTNGAWRKNWLNCPALTPMSTPALPPTTPAPPCDPCSLRGTGSSCGAFIAAPIQPCTFSRPTGPFIPAGNPSARNAAASAITMVPPAWSSTRSEPPCGSTAP